MSGLQHHTRVQFGLFVADLTAGELYRRGMLVRLEDQPFQFLAALLERPGDIVTREELRRRLWNDREFGEFERGLNTAAMKVRRALGDSADSPRFIERLPRRGYRFIAPVAPADPAPVSQQQSLAQGMDPPEGDTPSLVATRSEDPRVPSRRFWFGPGTTRGGTVTVLVMGVSAIALLATVLMGRPSPAPPLEEEPLTTNSDEDPVTAAAISPDGKYLVYAQQDGVWILDVGTREKTAVQPTLSRVTGLAWSGDAASVLMSGFEDQSGRAGLWHLSVLTRIARQLRADVSRAAITPDGKRIAFVDDSGRQVWVMDVGGSDARRLLQGEEGDTFREIAWSPDGRRILLGRLHLATFDLQITLESLDEEGRLTTLLRSDPGLRGTVVTRDGRLIYARAEAPPRQNDTSLWQSDKADWIRGTVSTPRRIARLSGTEVAGLSVTADGSRLALLKGPHQADVYVAHLQSPGVLTGNVRRLTVDERNDLPTAWTQDGASVIFHADRRGRWEVYRQHGETRQAELLVSGPNDYRGARLSPDGQALYYFERPIAERTWQWIWPVKVMRVPLGGGPAETIVEGRSFFSFRCARAPSRTCVLGERGWNDISFSVLDDIDGDGPQPLAGVATDAPLDQTHWDLSPDGSRIAVVLRDTAGSARIRTLNLDDRSTRDIIVNGRSGFQSIDWSADGRGWYVSTAAGSGARILYVLEDGQAKVVRDQPRSFGTWAIPSPDGRRLAILEWSAATNVWMVNRAAYSGSRLPALTANSHP